MDERMRRRGPPLRLLVLAGISLALAMSCISAASTDPGEDEISARSVASNVAGERQLALGEARTAATSRRVPGVLGRARATARPRGAGNAGPEAPPASVPGLDVAAPPAGGAEPPTPAAPAPGPPAAEPPTTPTPTAPTAPPEPAPPNAPAPPASGPPTPAPPPQPKPVPQPPPQTSTPDIDPGVPLEPAPSPGGSLVLGIDGGYAGWSDSEISQRAALGAAVTRHEWDPLDPVEEQDEEVEIAAAEIHTRIHALLGGNDLGDPNRYRDFVIAFIGRYGVGGSFWAEHPELDASRYAITTIELGNEPYFGEMSPEEYAATVRPTLEEIQRLRLPVQVVLPSRVYGDDTSWIDTLYALIPNLNSLFYAFADHPYWYGRDPATVSAAGPFGRIETLRRRMDEHGAADKPIFITEYGQSTADCGVECVSEALQATYLKQVVDAVVSRPHWDVEMLSIFQLIDRGTDSSDRELQFGLLREDGTPKPAYEFVRAAMQLYR